MQAVILAAGQGKRLRPLTDEIPKPMITLAGKPILAHVIESLPPTITEVIMVIGYRGEKIRDFFGDAYRGLRIQYAYQNEARGTANALHAARPLLSGGTFLLVPGDNIADLSALEYCVDDAYTLFAYHHPHPENFGVIELNEDGATLRRIQEKPEHPPTNLISTSCMVLPMRFFDYPLVLNEKYGEYFIPDILTHVLHDEPIYVIEQSFWVAVDRPEDIPRAEEALKNRGKMIQ
jgi:UDP-N-acetylglucosamine diphosphorylase / glucose-1-phosphate thymidylyltransferase / UDP-N-acetylgalactosamine diphosphorylase / glucosamine-1-phosphate N-acetyltransferase / galactosamine-1-phosphate N-acetyltransferase